MLDEIEKYFGHKLPALYRKFLIEHDGRAYGDTRLYALDEIIERNECYEVKLYAPGYINIGDDGGGNAYILRLECEDPEVHMVGHGIMNPDFKEFLCSSFSAWQLQGFPSN